MSCGYWHEPLHDYELAWSLCMCCGGVVLCAARSDPQPEDVEKQLNVVFDHLMDPEKTLHFLSVNWWFHIISQHACVTSCCVVPMHVFSWLMTL